MTSPAAAPPSTPPPTAAAADPPTAAAADPPTATATGQPMATDVHPPKTAVEPATVDAATAHESPWWRRAVMYQVYIRSFADADGDGLGDIAGIRSKLPYIASLGVDAIWINPWYPSPMADAGYDISDYRAVDARFGTLADAEALIREAHELRLRVLLDIVPNHTSDQHPWFLAARSAAPGSPERDRYLFRPSRPSGSNQPRGPSRRSGPDQPSTNAAAPQVIDTHAGGATGDQPPNDWLSVFGGSAWQRVADADGTPGEWYLHLFAPEQPDLNWNNPDVRADFDETLRFWFDRGVDGFRIDVANSLVKQDGLPDLDGLGHPALEEMSGPEWNEHPHWDRSAVHEIYRGWRRLADSYADPRVFVAEAWVDAPERLARYVRSDELHTAFNFDFLRAPWTAAALRATIDTTLAEHAAVGAPPTWVLSNHDVARHLSRYARPQTHPMRSLDDLLGEPADLQVGERRARAAALLMLALPGGAYIYQGDELGLPEVEDLPEDVLDDPTWERSGHSQRGRDGCRVPIPWADTEPPYGFSSGGARPWLPQPTDWGRYSVAVLEGDPASMLWLYRTALRIRRAHPALGEGTMRWLASPDGVLMFARDLGFVCVVNLSADPFPLPAGEQSLSSGPLDRSGAIPPDTAVWLSTP